MTTGDDQSSPGNTLPPMVGAIKDGSIEWKRIRGIDYELLGYFLSCHLIVEHYMDEFLKTSFPGLAWEAAKTTFRQKVALLTNMGLPEQFNCIPPIKHMNTLRNKISHRLDFAIDTEALLPMIHYIRKIAGDRLIDLETPKQVLEHFTMLCCSTMAGNISRQVGGRT